MKKRVTAVMGFVLLVAATVLAFKLGPIARVGEGLVVVDAPATDARVNSANQIGDEGPAGAGTTSAFHWSFEKPVLGELLDERETGSKERHRLRRHFEPVRETFLVVRNASLTAANADIIYTRLDGTRASKRLRFDANAVAAIEGHKLLGIHDATPNVVAAFASDSPSFEYQRVGISVGRAFASELPISTHSASTTWSLPALRADESIRVSNPAEVGASLRLTCETASGSAHTELAVPAGSVRQLSSADAGCAERASTGAALSIDSVNGVGIAVERRAIQRIEPGWYQLGDKWIHVGAESTVETVSGGLQVRRPEGRASTTVPAAFSRFDEVPTAAVLARAVSDSAFARVLGAMYWTTGLIAAGLWLVAFSILRRIVGRLVDRLPASLGQAGHHELELVFIVARYGGAGLSLLWTGVELVRLSTGGL